MGLVRVTALKDFRNTGLSTTDQTTGYQLGAPSTGTRVYFGMHLTSASLGTTQRILAMSIQSATASGFGSPSTRAQFTMSTVHGAEWATPVGGLSTEHTWWRAVWSLTTAVTTGGIWKGLVYMGFRRNA